MSVELTQGEEYTFVIMIVIHCQIFFHKDCTSLSVAVNESAYLNTSLLTVCNQTY